MHALQEAFHNSGDIVVPGCEAFRCGRILLAQQGRVRREKACQGRPVSDDQLAILAQQVEEQLRSTGVSNVSTNEVGKAILPFLRDLDVIAYLRFASVYRAFDTLEDFEEAIQALRERSQAGETASPEQTPVASKKTRKPRASRKRTSGQALLGDE